jgi:hypothetical protein
MGRDQRVRRRCGNITFETGNTCRLIILKNLSSTGRSTNGSFDNHKIILVNSLFAKEVWYDLETKQIDFCKAK